MKKRYFVDFNSYIEYSKLLLEQEKNKELTENEIMREEKNYERLFQIQKFRKSKAKAEYSITYPLEKYGYSWAEHAEYIAAKGIELVMEISQEELKNFPSKSITTFRINENNRYEKETEELYLLAVNVEELFYNDDYITICQEYIINNNPFYKIDEYNLNTNECQLTTIYKPQYIEENMYMDMGENYKEEFENYISYLKINNNHNYEFAPKPEKKVSTMQKIRTMFNIKK